MLFLLLTPRLTNVTRNLHMRMNHVITDYHQEPERLQEGCVGVCVCV